LLHDRIEVFLVVDVHGRDLERGVLGSASLSVYVRTS
jgi:hypothetical protein